MEGHRPLSLQWRSAIVLGLALGLAGFSVVAPVSVGLTDPAAAATVTLGAIQANVSNHHGTDGGTDTSNCIKYSPTGTSTSSAFVGSSGEALTAHGSDGTCPEHALDRRTERGRRIKPATTTSVQDGVPFLLARVTHYNNPIQAQAAHFSGSVHDPAGRLRHHPGPHLQLVDVGDAQQREPLRVHRRPGCRTRTGAPTRSSSPARCPTRRSRRAASPTSWS